MKKRKKLKRKKNLKREKTFQTTDLEKMGLHIVEAGIEDQLKVGGVWHFWYKLILVHHLQNGVSRLKKEFQVTSETKSFF